MFKKELDRIFTGIAILIAVQCLVPQDSFGLVYTLRLESDSGTSPLPFGVDSIDSNKNFSGSLVINDDYLLNGNIVSYSINEWLDSFFVEIGNERFTYNIPDHMMYLENYNSQGSIDIRDGKISSIIVSIVWGYLQGNSSPDDPSLYYSVYRNVGLDFKLSPGGDGNQWRAWDSHYQMSDVYNEWGDEMISGRVILEEDAQEASPVPEPSTLFSFGIGVIGLVFANRSRKK